MTNKELDALWFRAMEASIRAGEELIRYRFADLVAAAEREACAQICYARCPMDGTVSVEVELARAIRARGDA